ncbi:MAG: hypothetical protein UX81_C0017G0014 [Parcubacteria group bacterium GW2011_GWA2_47_12]|nr:MAG: hypothetical protein UX81_C0017G0014 [Parcubacteria group bacterium GW2011_GWA2_47_12]
MICSNTMIQKPHNTKEKGVIESLVYKEGDVYVGVCLTFGIVEEGNDPVKLLQSIKEASLLHLRTVVARNMSDDLLNRYAPNEYWEKYYATLKTLVRQQTRTSKKTAIPTPYFSRNPYSQATSPIIP